MNAPTNIPVITGPDGQPAGVKIPHADCVAQRAQAGGLIPHDVVSRTVDGATPVRAWREYLGLTQLDMAARLGISQSAYAQQEAREHLRRSTLEKIAAALGIGISQLDV